MPWPPPARSGHSEVTCPDCGVLFQMYPDLPLPAVTGLSSVTPAPSGLSSNVAETKS